MIKLQDITPAQVFRAYMGKPGCMCGCKGKYYYSERHPHGTVDPAMVTKVLRTIQANDELATLDAEGQWAAARVGNKEYCVYLTA